VNCRTAVGQENQITINERSQRATIALDLGGGGGIAMTSYGRLLLPPPQQSGCQDHNHLAVFSVKWLAYWLLVSEVSGLTPTDDGFFYVLSRSALKAVTAITVL